MIAIRIIALFVIAVLLYCVCPLLRRKISERLQMKNISSIQPDDFDGRCRRAKVPEEKRTITPLFSPWGYIAFPHKAADISQLF